MFRPTVCSLIAAVLLCCSPLPAALVVTLDQPIITVAPGGLASFTGSLTNTGPEAFGLGVSPELAPVPSAPFLLGIPLGLAGFQPGPGGSYIGEIFAIFVDLSAVPGDSYTGVLTVAGLQMAGPSVLSDPLTIQVNVSGVPEPGSALLLTVPALGFVLLRKRLRASCR